jgi:hypothetical protein
MAEMGIGRRSKRGMRASAAGGSIAVLLLSTGPSVAQVVPSEIESGDSSLFSSRVLTTNLSNPWAMRWGPDDMIWLTERTSGEVTRIDPVSGAQQVLLTLDDVYTGPQHEGLLGLALHPGLLQGTGNDYVYLSYTINNGTVEEPDPSAQIVRYTYNAELQQLVEPGAELSVVIFPILLAIEEWSPRELRALDEIQSILADLGIRRFDLTPVLRRALSAGIEVAEGPGDSWHPSDVFAEMAAEELHSAGLLVEPAATSIPLPR